MRNPTYFAALQLCIIGIIPRCMRGDQSTKLITEYRTEERAVVLYVALKEVVVCLSGSHRGLNFCDVICPRNYSKAAHSSRHWMGISLFFHKVSNACLYKNPHDGAIRTVLIPQPWNSMKNIFLKSNIRSL